MARRLKNALIELKEQIKPNIEYNVVEPKWLKSLKENYQNISQEPEVIQEPESSELKTCQYCKGGKMKQIYSTDTPVYQCSKCYQVVRD